MAEILLLYLWTTWLCGMIWRAALVSSCPVVTGRLDGLGIEPQHPKSMLYLQLVALNNQSNTHEKSNHDNNKTLSFVSNYICWHWIKYHWEIVPWHVQGKERLEYLPSDGCLQYRAVTPISPPQQEQCSSVLCQPSWFGWSIVGFCWWSDTCLLECLPAHGAPIVGNHAATNRIKTTV